MRHEREVQISSLLIQFGEDVPIKKIAQYAEDEFLIPKEEAVKIIYERVKSGI